MEQAIAMTRYITQEDEPPECTCNSDNELCECWKKGDDGDRGDWEYQVWKDKKMEEEHESR